jgi:tRNA threonylcarbamoyladenosine biosynthesis protein TsaB
MLLLAVDTAGATGSVLLAQGTSSDALLPLGAMDLAGRAYSVQIFPAISALLQQHHTTLADVDGFVVVRGPGSFTGLRVGLSAVKGLAEATGKPVIALSRLAVMASLQPQAPLVHAILDAGRGEFYHGIYRDVGWECVQESLETAETLRAALAASLTATEGVFLVAEAVEAAGLSGPPPGLLQGKLLGQSKISVVHVVAVDILPLAQRAWRQQCFADVALLDANYLRRSDAELFSRHKHAAAHPQGR